MTTSYSTSVKIGAVDKFSGAFRKLGREIKDVDRLQGELAKHQQRRQNLRGQAVETLALGAALAIPVKKAIDLESALADVNKVMDFSAPDGLLKLEKNLQRLSRTIPMTATELSEIAAAGGQLGIKEKDILKFTETTAKVATAFDITAEESGDNMAKLSNVFDIPINKVGKLADAVNHLSDNTTAKAPAIVKAMLKVGGTARTFGLSTEKTAALADAFIALGKEPEVAGTAINAMLSKLQTANVQEKKFKKALASIGFSASEMGTMVRNDAQGAIMKLLETLEKLDKKRRAEVLTQLFGQEYQDDIGLLVTGLDNYRKALSLVAKEENYAGSVQREFANRSATTANELKLLKNRSDEVQQNFGRGLNPAIKQVSRSLAPVVDSISDWTAANPELTAGIGLVAGGVLALKVAILAQSFAFNKLTESIIKANVALGNFNATQAAGTLASPVGMPDIGRGLVPQIGKSPGRFGKWLGKIPGGGKALAAGAALSGMLGRVPGSKAIGGMFGSIGGGLAKAGGALGKVPGGKVVGGFLKRFGPVGALLTAASLSGALMSGDSKEIGGELGGFGGMLAGGAAGAAVGSVIPGIGTAIGGIIGSIVGGIGGDQLGRVLAEKVESQVDSKTAEAVKPKKDTLEVSMKLDFQGRPQITGVRMNGDKDLKFRADMGMMPE